MARNHAPDESELALPNDQHPIVTWKNGICTTTRDVTKIGVMPGSFNPLHDGHLRLREAASEFLGRPVVFEISVANVDKPRLTPAVLRQRLQQFTDCTVMLTDAALFADKAKLFERCWFVVGMDTAIRLLDPRYYGDSSGQRDNALRMFQSLDIRFLVAGRLLNDNDAASFKRCDQLMTDEASQELFVELPEKLFRVDISSSALRSEANGDRTADE